MTRSTTWDERLHRSDGLPLGRESGRTTKRLRLAALLGLLLTMWLLPQPASAATTWVVDADGFGAVGNCADETVSADSLTINGAVALATAGDTIQVCAGTYAELVVVNKALTLQGIQHGQNPATRSGDESVVTGNAGSTSFFVTADDVRIDGFTVRDQTNVNQFGAGIVLGAGTSHASILDNRITHNVVGLFLANDGASGQTLIWRNYFLDNDNPGAASGHGIYTDQFVAGGTLTNVLIERNLFQDHAGQGIGFSSSAAAPATNVTISHNSFSGNGRGLYAFNLTSSTIERNLFIGSTGAGTADLRIFEGSSDLTIDHNLLQDGAGRAYRASSGTGAGAPSGIHLNRNSITGYTGPDGIVQNDPGLPTLDAECNWWGSSTGPGAAGTEGDVDFTPWLNDDDIDGACPSVVDTAGPDITITTPADGATYERGSSVTADYECTDTSGVTECSGPVPDGEEIDTSVAGHYSFTVNAEDTFENTSSATNEYDITQDGCLIDEDPVSKTMTFVSDCTVDSSFMVPDGYTVDGDGFTLFGVDPPGGHFLGAVIRNEAGTSWIAIRNLTVDADTLADVCDPPSPDTRLRGILLASTGGEVTDNMVDIGQGPEGKSGCQEGNAIEARNAPFDNTGVDAEVVITGNVVNGYIKGGIVANGSVAATITGNTVTGWGPVGVPFAAQNGIQIGFGATAIVRNNVVSGNDYTPDTFVACGLLYFDADGVRANHNTLFNNERDTCNFGKGGGKFNPNF